MNSNRYLDTQKAMSFRGREMVLITSFCAICWALVLAILLGAYTLYRDHSRLVRLEERVGVHQRYIDIIAKDLEPIGPKVKGRR